MKKVLFYLQSLLRVVVSPRRAFLEISKDNNQVIAFLLVWTIGFLLGQFIQSGCLCDGAFDWIDIYLHWVTAPLLALTLYYSSGFFIHSGARYFGGKGRLGQVWVGLAWANLLWLLVLPLCLVIFPMLSSNSDVEFFYMAVVFCVTPAWVFILFIIAVSTVEGISTGKALWLVFLGSILSFIPFMVMWEGLVHLDYFLFQNG